LPVLPGNQSPTITVQQMVNQLKANPEFFNVLGGAAGYSTEPALTIANEVMSRILAENMPWKWNRVVYPPFLTVSLQQDYVSNITNIGWLENGWLIDINNSTSNANGAPKPIRGLETVRDMVGTSTQAVPFNVSFIPNTQAQLGLWQANTAYSCGYGVPMTPRTPIQQFMDVNGNILFIDSTGLGLNIESPGYTGTTILPPGTPFPYGISGATQPAAPPNATPGDLVQDNTVIWTVADQSGYAMRLGPVPALNGLTWLVVIQYQVQPPWLYTLQQSLNPIPAQMLYLFRAGCRAQLLLFNGSKTGAQAYAEWEEQLRNALRAGDRQQDDFAMYPSQSLMGGNDPWGNTWAGVGAANPYGSALYGSGYGT
jgi:hypothetical protein